MRKSAIVLLLLVTLLAMPINSYAETSQSTQVTKSTEAITFTLDDCMNKAVDYSHQTAVLEQQIEDLWKQQNDLMEMSNAVQQQLDLLARFEGLYEKRENGITFTLQEQGEFLGYQYMFGLKPPEYTQAELFNNFIKNRDFPHYSVWATVQNLYTNKTATVASIKMGVKQLFDSATDMQDSLLLQQELYDNMKKQNEQMLAKYKNGLVSEINKYISDVSLEKQRLSIEKLKRSLANMKMSLKQQIGILLQQEIVLDPYNNSKGIKPFNTYSTYLNQALKNRFEILIAKMDLQVKQREDDIVKQYFTNELLSERMDADQALEEKDIAYKEAVNNVTADISSGFKDVQLKKSNFHISVAKLQNEERRYKDAELKYNKGLISIADLWNAEISSTQARVSYNKAMRDYNNAVYRLDAACGIGPGYTSGSGGY